MEQKQLVLNVGIEEAVSFVYRTSLAAEKLNRLKASSKYHRDIRIFIKKKMGLERVKWPVRKFKAKEFEAEVEKMLCYIAVKKGLEYFVKEADISNVKRVIANNIGNIDNLQAVVEGLLTNDEKDSQK